MTPPRSSRQSRVVTLLTITSALLVCELVAAKSARDALFLSRFGAGALPPAITAAAALSLAAAFGAAALMQRVGPVKSTRALLYASAALLALIALVLEAAPGVAVALFYAQVSALGATTVSGFWAVVTEHFDAHSARSAVARIAAAAPVGGLVGGLSAAPVLRSAGTPALLGGLAVLHVLAAQAIAGLPAARSAATAGARPQGGLSVLRSSGYLQRLSLLVAVTALLGTLLDYSLKASAAATFQDTAALLTFFGGFYTVTSIAATLVQLGATRKVLHVLGLGGALSTLPGFSLLGAGIVLFLPGFLPIVLLRGGASVLENTLFRSAYEPLYTPVPVEEKRAAKTIIDVASERLGDMLGGGALLVVAAFVAGNTTPLLGAMAAAAVGLWLSLSVHRGYVKELAQSLRLGVVQLRDSDVHDRTTRLTLSQTALELDREALLQKVAKLQAEQRRGVPGELAFHAAVGSAGERQALVSAVATLLSGDPPNIKALLGSELDARLLPFVIPLLGRDDLAEVAGAALGRMARDHAGALGDALSTQPVEARRRIPPLLQAVDDDRAHAALCTALSDPDLEVRHRSAMALRYARERSGKAPERALLLAAVLREIESIRQRGEVLLGPARGQRRPDRALRHVFVLLSLAFDREGVELSFTALLRGDPKLRGAALEYLSNVLPQPVRDALLGELAVTRELASSPVSARPDRDLVDELKRSLDGVSTAELRAHLSPPPE